MPRRTYIEANLLIAAWHGRDDAGTAALSILDDPQRALVVSAAAWLEVMPKPLYYRQQAEIDFYRSVFDRAEHIPWRLDTLRQAEELAERYGIAAMDAIHIAMAIGVRVDEFVSAEKPDKPMFRVTEIPMRSIRAVTP